MCIQQLKSAWTTFRGKHCTLYSSTSSRIKRSQSDPSFVLSDFDLGNKQCVSTIQNYGDVCFSIFINVISDIEAFKAIREIGETCSSDWVKCFLKHGGGKLDPILRRLNPDFTRMCEYNCWDKMFDLVMHCVHGDAGVKTVRSHDSVYACQVTYKHMLCCLLP